MIADDLRPGTMLECIVQHACWFGASAFAMRFDVLGSVASVRVGDVVTVIGSRPLVINGQQRYRIIMLLHMCGHVCGMTLCVNSYGLKNWKLLT